MQKNTAVIRLDAIRHNAEIFSGLAGVKKLCAVVKADAYGHGAAAVAQSVPWRSTLCSLKNVRHCTHMP